MHPKGDCVGLGTPKAVHFFASKTTNSAEAWIEAPDDEKELVAPEGKMVVTVPSFKPFSLLDVLCFLLVGVSTEFLSHLMIVDPYDSCQKNFILY